MNDLIDRGAHYREKSWPKPGLDIEPGADRCPECGGRLTSFIRRLKVRNLTTHVVEAVNVYHCQKCRQCRQLYYIVVGG